MGRVAFQVHEFVKRVLEEAEKHLANLHFAATDDHLRVEGERSWNQPSEEPP